MTDRPARAALLLLPLIGVALAVLAVIAIDPVSRFTAAPPQDSLEVERTILREGEIELRLRNAGPEAVTVAQVQVADEYLVHRIDDRTLDRFEATTLRIAFLLVDTLAAGIEIGGGARSPFGRVELFGLGALASAAGLAAITSRSHAAGGAGSSMSRARLALFVAIGVGLHNFGEGLAVGAAVSAGDLALGSGLVVGFAVHNTTEGLAIVAPMAEDGGRWRSLAVPALVAGVPTVAGSVAGGAVVAPAFTLLALGVAFGAIAEVVRAVARTVLARRHPAAAGAGFVVGVAVMYLTGIFAA